MSLPTTCINLITFTSLILNFLDFCSTDRAETFSDLLKNVFLSAFETRNVTYIGTSGFNVPLSNPCALLISSFDTLSFQFEIIHMQIAYEDTIAIGSPTLIAFQQLSLALYVISGLSLPGIDDNSPSYSPKAIYYPSNSVLISYLLFPSFSDVVYHKRPIQMEFIIRVSRKGITLLQTMCARAIFYLIHVFDLF